jgi:rRNA maturation protein Nop10
MALHAESRSDSASRSVRTEVTVHQEQRSILFSGPTETLSDTCPLCGNPLFPPTPQQTNAFPQDPAQPHGNCPGPDHKELKELKDQPIDPPHSGDSRRLR